MFVQNGVNLGAPIAVSQNLGPPHFPRDKFIALRVVDVILQQLHVCFRPLVRLLEQALPIVFVPDSFPFALEVGHDWTKRQLGRARKKFPRFTNLLSATRAWFGDAIGRRPRRYRGLSRGVTSPQFCAPVRSTRIFPVDLPTVATRAGRARCCTESDSLWPKAAWRDWREVVLARLNRSRRQ